MICHLAFDSVSKIAEYLSVFPFKEFDRLSFLLQLCKLLPQQGPAYSDPFAGANLLDDSFASFGSKFKLWPIREMLPGQSSAIRAS